MSMEDTNPRTLQELLDRLLDGRLSDADLAALEEILREDPAARDTVLDYCQFHAILLFESHAERAVHRLIEARGSQKAVADADAPVKVLVQRIPLSRLTPRRVALLCAAAALLVAAVTPWMMRPKTLSFAKVDAAGRPQLASIKIESSSAELALADIGTVVVQGPADFEMLGPKRARLKYGRIKVAVTKPGERGFVVEMPNAEVTDLGTEFGIDVSREGTNGLVVFKGAVDLRVPNSPLNTTQVHVERLVEGEGVVVNQTGSVDRIMAIFTGQDATFGQIADGASGVNSPVIVDVTDNLRTAETKKFYEIATRGLGEDARAYVDRPEHEWNGIDERGMPAYLIGADYVKPFNNDKMRKGFELRVKLGQPARLFVFFDKRIPVPSWLSESFGDTGDVIGMDVGPRYDAQGNAVSRTPRGIGPANEVDNMFSVWEQVVPEAGTVTLGENSGVSVGTGMYGIAAAALKPQVKQRETVDESAARILALSEFAPGESAKDPFRFLP
jgi:ferric-dicitrate binding protein FerR (iron transport regulator)